MRGSSKESRGLLLLRESPDSVSGFFFSMPLFTNTTGKSRVNNAWKQIITSNKNKSKSDFHSSLIHSALPVFCISFSILQLESSILSVICVFSYMFYTLFPPSPSLSLALCASFLGACKNLGRMVTWRALSCELGGVERNERTDSPCFKGRRRQEAVAKSFSPPLLVKSNIPSQQEAEYSAVHQDYYSVGSWLKGRNLRGYPSLRLYVWCVMRWESLLATG